MNVYAVKILFFCIYSQQFFLLSGPPQPPVIYGYNEGMGIPEGKIQEISCVSRGGNPPAYLEWYKDDRSIKSQTSQSSDFTKAVINIIADTSDNGARYRFVKLFKAVLFVKVSNRCYGPFIESC